MTQLVAATMGTEHAQGVFRATFCVSLDPLECASMEDLYLLGISRMG